MRLNLRLVFIGLFFATSGFVLIEMFIPDSFVQRKLISIFEWVQQLEPLSGALVLASTYALAVSCMLPGTPFNLGAGYLFGFSVGSPVAVLGALMGANGAFLMGRFLVRAWAEEKMRSDRRFRAIDRAIKRNGIYLVALMRLSPVLPFPLLSYIFGVTQIRWYDHFLGTFCGILPATIMEAYLGQEMQGLSEALNHKQSGSLSWLFVVIVITFASLAFVSYISHQALTNAMNDEESPPPSPSSSSSAASASASSSSSSSASAASLTSASLPSSSLASSLPSSHPSSLASALPSSLASSALPSKGVWGTSSGISLLII